MLAAAMMLDHVGEIEAASRLRRALETAIVKDNVRTRIWGAVLRPPSSPGCGPPALATRARAAAT